MSRPLSRPLALVEPMVRWVTGNQVLVGALAHDPAVLDDHDLEDPITTPYW